MNTFKRAILAITVAGGMLLAFGAVDAVAQTKPSGKSNSSRGRVRTAAITTTGVAGSEMGAATVTDTMTGTVTMTTTATGMIAIMATGTRATGIPTRTGTTTESTTPFLSKVLVI